MRSDSRGDIEACNHTVPLHSRALLERGYMVIAYGAAEDYVYLVNERKAEILDPEVFR